MGYDMAVMTPSLLGLCTVLAFLFMHTIEAFSNVISFHQLALIVNWKV